MKVFFAAFLLYLQFVLAKFWRKVALNVLMNLTTGVNFTNILRAAFLRADHKSAKDTYDLTVFLRFWDLRQNVLVKYFIDRNSFKN